MTNERDIIFCLNLHKEEAKERNRRLRFSLRHLPASGTASRQEAGDAAGWGAGRQWDGGLGRDRSPNSISGSRCRKSHSRIPVSPQLTESGEGRQNYPHDALWINPHNKGGFGRTKGKRQSHVAKILHKSRKRRRDERRWQPDDLSWMCLPCAQP